MGDPRKQGRAKDERRQRRLDETKTDVIRRHAVLDAALDAKADGERGPEKDAPSV